MGLIMSATCFAQHYSQTDLVSNTAGVTPVTDPGSDLYDTASRPLVGL